VIYFAAVLNGFGAAILWVAQGNYISQCAYQGNKGTYNAVFWFFYMGSHIVGNILAAFVIVNVSQVQFYIIMTLICLGSSLMFLRLKQPKSYSLLESLIVTDLEVR
jgi:hypothetical protein